MSFSDWRSVIIYYLIWWLKERAIGTFASQSKMAVCFDRRLNFLAQADIKRIILDFCRRQKSRIMSGRLDSNQRPLAPHTSALPGCATTRENKIHKNSVALSRRSLCSVGTFPPKADTAGLRHYPNGRVQIYGKWSMQ